MSARNRPVCSYVADYYVGQADDTFGAECSDPPTHAVLYREKESDPWRQAMADGEFMYACDFHARTRFADRPDPCWSVAPLLRAGWDATRAQFLDGQGPAATLDRARLRRLCKLLNVHADALWDKGENGESIGIALTVDTLLRAIGDHDAAGGAGYVDVLLALKAGKESL